MMNPLRDVWQSIVRRDPLSTDKGKSELVFLNVWLHIHPAKVKKENLKVKHTFYLGFITFFLFLILVTTGVALMFYYRPNPPQAYQDMKDLQFVVYLGGFLRNMHRWSAHGMVICVFLHMCRVFYTGSYKRPRQFNWVIGVVLHGPAPRPLEWFEVTLARDGRLRVDKDRVVPASYRLMVS